MFGIWLDAEYIIRGNTGYYYNAIISILNKLSYNFYFVMKSQCLNFKDCETHYSKSSALKSRLKQSEHIKFTLQSVNAIVVDPGANRVGAKSAFGTRTNSLLWSLFDLLLSLAAVPRTPAGAIKNLAHLAGCSRNANFTARSFFTSVRKHICAYVFIFPDTILFANII